jgi:predicted nucleic acid-binding protein
VAELVLDASVFGSLFLNEERADEIHHVVKTHHIYAPSFWKFEVSNAVWKKKEIHPETSKDIIERIWRFPVYISESKELAVESLLIARKHGITFYDSFYIAIAKILNMPLWTIDNVQARAAGRTGVSLWE